MDRCRVPKVGGPLLGSEFMARAIVDLEIDINSDNVGLPVTSVVLLPQGGYRIARLLSRLPNLCEAKESNKK